MRGMSMIAKIGLLAAVVGAGSWLVVGVWHYNFVADIFGSGTAPSATTGERIIYIVFGVGAVICLPLLAAALGGSRAGRRTKAEADRAARAEAERTTQARSDALTSRQQAEAAEDQQMVVDYQEFKEFQAWRAGKHAQEASTEAGPAEQIAE
jgi:uncharacterized membrane protein YuzA (DUF378 family)